MRNRWIVASAIFLVACEGLGTEAPAPPLTVSFGALQATASAPPFCQGVPRTIYVDTAGLIVGGPDDGQPYAGVLRGTPGPDVIVGTAGPDIIHGGDGDDRLCGLAGNDQLNGDAGDDVAFGAEGDDHLTGGDGEDDLLGEAGVDVAVGGAAFDNCDSETSQQCEWTEPVQRLACFSSHGWDVVPGSGFVAEAFLGNRPPSGLFFENLDGATPDGAIAEMSTYYTRTLFGDPSETLLTDWLTPGPRVVPASPGGFRTTVAPFAPPESRGKRDLAAYVTAKAPGFVTLVPCMIRMNVLDPRLLPAETTLTAQAGSTAPISGSIPLVQTGSWSFFSPTFRVEIGYQPADTQWLATRVDFTGNQGGDLHLTADATNLSPGTYTAEVTLFVPDFPAVPHTAFKVTLIVSPPAASARTIRLHGSDGEPSGRPIPAVPSPIGSL